jgi:hypothetical protein
MISLGCKTPNNSLFLLKKHIYMTKYLAKPKKNHIFAPET